MIRFIKQWGGYCLTGDIREHALVFGFGNGKNGKSVWMKGYRHHGRLRHNGGNGDLHRLEVRSASDRVGDAARGAAGDGERDRGRPRMGREPDQTDHGRRSHHRAVHAEGFLHLPPNFKLTIIGNHKPLLRNVDEAARRRFNLIPFNRTPANPDPLLGQKLRTEWPGILRWMIEGCLDWQESGLVRPESVIAATESYFDDQDLLSQWLDEECDAEPGNRYKWETTAKLFESWTEFANHAGEYPGSRKTFTTDLARRGFEHFRHGHANTRSFKGLRLKPKPSAKRYPDDE